MNLPEELVEEIILPYLIYKYGKIIYKILLKLFIKYYYSDLTKSAERISLTIIFIFINSRHKIFKINLFNYKWAIYLVGLEIRLCVKIVMFISKIINIVIHVN